MSWLGRRYVEAKQVNLPLNSSTSISDFVFVPQMPIDISLAQQTYEELDKMETAIRAKFKK
jgi:hypothetical protein